MKPLHLFAYGLVFVGLNLMLTNGWDALPGPVGWLLTLWALRLLGRRTDLQRRGLLLAVGLVAVAAATLTWVPAGVDWVKDSEDAVQWAVGMPAMLYCGLVCLELSRLARTDTYATPTALLQWTGFGFFASAVAPVLIIGGGQDWLEVPAAAVNAFAQLSLFLMCLVYAGRDWAGPTVRVPSEP